MRSLWSGALSFGLINMPVKLYSASTEKNIDLDYLHKKDLAPIRYAKICREDGHEVPYDDIVKGYEYKKGDYIVLTEEDFKRANAKKTKAIEITEFIHENEVDTVLFEKPYYLEPDRGADKAYALLREALKQSKKVGVARFVMRTRERIGILKPEGNVVVLNQVRYPREMRKTDDLHLPQASDVSKKELDMAIALVDQLTSKFDPNEYKDTYKEELERVIEEKAKGHVPKPKGKEPEPTEVRDLMKLLRKSLEQQQQKSAVPN